MRVKLMLDVIDELGHSYNLMRALGYGFIDLGDLTDEPPGDPGDYYPPALDNPIEPPPIGEPATQDQDVISTQTPRQDTEAFTPAAQDQNVIFTPAPLPDEEGYTPPAPDLPRGFGNMGGTRGHSGFPGDSMIYIYPAGQNNPAGGDPCASVENPAETVSIGYTTQSMQVNETQELEVLNYHPKWSYENYSWAILSGGGTLHVTGADPPEYLPGPEEEGYDPEAVIRAFNVTYTAPATNAECVKNPVIGLICEGNTVDTLSLGVNAKAGCFASESYWGFIIPYKLTCVLGPACKWSAKVYCCNGELQGTEQSAFCCDPGTACPCTTPTVDADCTSVCPELGVAIDIRTPLQITQGCCPGTIL
ncbi:MAG: hypothetical protein PHI16_01520 [Methanocellales archaeon]|nr:hypothetical protein [Methanocellales archaeon]